MTAPVDLRVLDEGHRARQAANALEVQRLVARLFVKMIDPVNITGTAQGWLREAIIAILNGRKSAITLATAYALAVRRLQVPDAPAFNIPRPPDPPMRKLVESLTFTGPGKLAVDLAKVPQPTEPSPGAPEIDFDRFEREMEQYERTLKEAPVKASVASSAAAYRHVTDGGRDLIDNVVTQDPVAVGYVRITKASPCAFCLMLASRGPVYNDDSFDQSDPRFHGPGAHKVHDACGCSLRPVFGSKSSKNWTDQARQAEKLWIDKAAGFSGRDAINAFARAAREAGVADLNRW